MAVGYPADLVVVPVTADAATTARFYGGFNFRNSTGAAITVSIYDGTSTAGVLIDSISIPANDSKHVHYPTFIGLTSGSVFVDWITGAVGSIRVVV